MRAACRIALLALALFGPGAAVAAEEEIAILGGGCFWCIEADLEKVPGVLDVVSGYSGGPPDTANYQAVSGGRSGHVEVVEVRFDPSVISYARLLDRYWREIDPVVENRQFCDRGPQYRTVIYTTSEAQHATALASRKALDDSGLLPGPVKTEVVRAGPFYPAEDYHQDYAKKNPLRYRYYRSGCGRDARLKALWGERSE
jgi:peptide-methionine (S)-S-oxide reductase